MLQSSFEMIKLQKKKKKAVYFHEVSKVLYHYFIFMNWITNHLFGCFFSPLQTRNISNTSPGVPITIIITVVHVRGPAIGRKGRLKLSRNAQLPSILNPYVIVVHQF